MTMQFPQGRVPLRFALVGAILATSSLAHAGPFILDLTDADDHGSVSAGVNQDGWFYMQRVLENLFPTVTNSKTLVVNLGSTLGTALSAQNSAFSLSTLPGAGWTFANVDGTTDIASFFDGTGATKISDAGIITIDSGDGNVGGGITDLELAIINLNAALLNNFLGGGGGLHSMAEDASGQYGWLSTLLPGLAFDSNQHDGLQLTGAGSSAFPGLSNADLSSGPHHGHWLAGLGGLTVLFTDNSSPFTAVGIGSSGGSVTNPNPPSVPEPQILFLFGACLVALGWVARRRRA